MPQKVELECGVVHQPQISFGIAGQPIVVYQDTFARTEHLQIICQRDERAMRITSCEYVTKGFEAFQAVGVPSGPVVEFHANIAKDVR